LKEGRDKGKVNRTVTVKKGDVKLSCSHCQRDGHEEDHCWKLHPNLKPKWSKKQKGRRKTTTIVQDLGSDSRDKSKVIAMGLKGNIFVCSSFASTSKIVESPDERKRTELFHT